TVKTGLYSEVLDVTSLQAGVYFITISGNNNYAVKKIIVKNKSSQWVNS
ncbi:MAG: T9SS type A sorting domain-containing protein, partial [Chitinophagaceae bacterium]